MSELENQNGSQEVTLSEDAQRVLDELAASDSPLDVILISSRTRLAVERVLEILPELEARGAIERVKPEPVHERFSPTGMLGPLQPA